MSKKYKVVGGIGIGILLAGLAVWGLWTWFSRQALPKTSGTIQVAGLQQPVEILRDEYGVAHIYAGNAEDLFFAEGFVHAQERFWQMEFQRRIAAGRLSEVFGESTVSTDIHLRHFNFIGNSKVVYLEMDLETRRMLDAYTAGINAYIEERTPSQLGLEFALLGLQGVKWEIEPWTPIDSLGWSMMMIYNQADVLPPELDNIELLATVGEAMYADLHPAYRADRPTILPDGEAASLKPLSEKAQPALPKLSQAEMDYLLGIRAQPERETSMANQLAKLGLGVKGASNSFVVSGQKTTTGMPLLANDPHMAVSMPAIWYQVGMHCAAKSEECPYNLRGYSLPGVPGILIGHNDRIAWGLTNASFDSEDVFLERINPANPNQYEVNGDWMEMTIQREEIIVNGKEEPVVIDVRSTRHGVVITDYLVDTHPYGYTSQDTETYALSFAWTALTPIRSTQAVMMVNKAQNWQEFGEALEFFDAGKQNWLYADVEGNIGYVLPGNIPVRAGGDGTLPVPGWNDEYAWTGFIPYDDLPRLFNPSQGFIVTANNPQIRPEESLYLIGNDFDRGQRAQRLTELIGTKTGPISLVDMQVFQTDNQSLGALETIPYLAALSFDDPLLTTARDRLLAWDGQNTLYSPEAALYNLFWKHLLADTFQDQLPEDAWPHGNHVNEDTVALLLTKPDSAWWDHLATWEIIEDRDTILRQAFEQAYEEGVQTLGEDFAKWEWGTLHTIIFKNATLGESGISLIENLFNRGPYPANGSDSVVQKTCWAADQSFDVYCIPAMRQVIDLGDLSNSRMIHSVGQSGHPASPQYDHFIELWRTFQYIPTNWERESAEAEDHQTLILQPEK